jgi:CelD/BcsL family acetyltransferase involved in cellulose biosynthesis
VKLDVTTTADPAQWDAAVLALGGTVYHSSAYARYVEAAEPNATAAYLTLAGPDGAPAGAAVAFAARSPRRLLRGLTGRVWLPALPAVGPAGRALLPEFLTAAEAHARAAGAVVLEVGSAASPDAGAALGALGYALTHRWEFELDLRPSEDELWEAMEYKRRKNIKKAVRMGVAVAELPPDEGLAELRRLQEHSSRRIVARGGPDIAKRGRTDDPAARLLEAGLGRIVGATLDGQVISAGLFTNFGGLVYHTLSGHSEEALRSQAPTLLLWETIKWYKTAGAQRLNFGGCSHAAEQQGHSEHGVYVYKLGFGAQRLACTSGRKVLRPVRHAIGKAVRRLGQR